MKKYILAFCMLAGLYACSTMDAPEPAATAPADSAHVTSIVRTPEEARTLAAEAFADFYGTSRSLARIKDVRTFTAAAPSRSGAATDTTFYVVNLDDNQGYAVIAASRNVEPVLAVTESGNIESIDSIENPGAKMFFETLTFEKDPNRRPINDSLTTIQPNPGWPGGDVNPWPNTTQYKTDVKIVDNKIENRTPFEWGQLTPEGVLFDNGVAGCDNTACMLAFSYFEHPKQITAEGITTNLDWPLIKTNKRTFPILLYKPDIEILTPAEQNLARGCHAVGVLNKSYPANEGKSTETIFANTYNTIKSFFPKTKIVYNEEPDAYSSLGNGVILVRASRENTKAGHVFIIDGYNHQVTTTTRYKREPGESLWDVISRSSTSCNYNHINWGWNGTDNGYFKVGVFDSSNASEYDNLTDNISYNYTTGFIYLIISL